MTRTKKKESQFSISNENMYLYKNDIRNLSQDQPDFFLFLVFQLCLFHSSTFSFPSSDLCLFKYYARYIMKKKKINLFLSHVIPDLGDSAEGVDGDDSKITPLPCQMLYFLLRYNRHITYQFQVYTAVIFYLCILHNDHHNMSSNIPHGTQLQNFFSL